MLQKTCDPSISLYIYIYHRCLHIYIYIVDHCLLRRTRRVVALYPGTMIRPLRVLTMVGVVLKFPHIEKWKPYLRLIHHDFLGGRWPKKLPSGHDCFWCRPVYIYIYLFILWNKMIYIYIIYNAAMQTPYNSIKCQNNPPCQPKLIQSPRIGGIRSYAWAVWCVVGISMNQTRCWLRRLTLISRLWKWMWDTSQYNSTVLLFICVRAVI